MVCFSGIKGAELAELRQALGLTQSFVAEAIGCAVLTVLRAEGKRDEPIGKALAARLAGHVVAGEEAWLELGLGPLALNAAEEYGLKSWYGGSFGFVFWRSAMHEWAAGFCRYRPASRSSQARHLCKRLGLEQRVGLTFCAICEEHEAKTPSVAFRRCSSCDRFVCDSASCGQELLPTTALARGRVVCQRCCKTPLIDALPSGSASLRLPGIGDASHGLAQRLEVAREPAELTSWRSDVEEHIHYYENHLRGIGCYLAIESVTPAALPDFAALLRNAFEQAQGELERLRKLLEIEARV